MAEEQLPSEEEINKGKEAVDILSQLSDILLQNLDINRQNVDAIKDSVATARDLAAPFNLTAEAAKKINKANRDLSSLNAEINASIKERNNLSRSSISVEKDLDKSKEIQKRILLEQNEITKKIVNARKSGLAESSAEVSALKDVRFGLEAQKDLNGDIIDQLSQEAKQVKKIETAFGLSGKALGVVDKLLGGSLGDVKKIEEGARKRLALLEKEGKLQDGIGGKMQGFGAIVGETGKSLMKNLNDPLVLLKAGLDFDKQATDLQRGMALSGKEAYAMNASLVKAAASSGDMAITSARTAKAFTTLQAQIGVASAGLADMAVDAAIMQEKIGLSDKAIGNAGKSSLILGKSMKNVKLDIIGATTSIRTQTGIALNYKDIMEKTLNVSGQISAQLGANPEKIAKAVAQANALGLELEQVAKVGESLLNFEQSIQAELEAELLTGKELNLEKARLLALTGDYEALSREIATQAGSFSDYSAMNVIQQQKLAQAFGMSAEEMSNMLIDQEAMGKTAAQLRAEGKEDIAQRLEARDAQQKFTDAVEKMKGIFVDLVGGPVGALLNMLTMALEPIGLMIEGATAIFGLFTGSTEELTAMNIIFGSIAIAIGTIVGLQKMSAFWAGRKAMFEGLSLKSLTRQNVAKHAGAAISGALAVLSGAKAIAEISAASALTLGIGIATIVAGIAVGVGAMNSAKADDAVFEGGGYGKRTLLEEGSITRFNDSDTIMAGTKLGRADDMISSPAGTMRAPEPPPPQPVVIQNEVVYDSYQSANYYNGPRSTEKSETGLFT